jgi:hypothetical protein
VSDRAFEAANVEATAELADLVATLSNDDFRRAGDDGWSVGVLLAHLAFWDRMVIVRWDRATAAGAACPDDLPDVAADLVNDALVPTWRSLTSAEAATLVLDAAADVDILVAALPDASVDAAVAAGRARLVDRSLHRHDHLAQIRRILDVEA